MTFTMSYCSQGPLHIVLIACSPETYYRGRWTARARCGRASLEDWFVVQGLSFQQEVYKDSESKHHGSFAQGLKCSSFLAGIF